ncbi:MAG: hypothetical protein CL595_05020, partial [Alteromonas sp.]|nr:hypothetical protein [Alteromonas sp.]
MKTTHASKGRKLNRITSAIMASSLPFLAAMSAPTFAQEAEEGAENVENIIVTGTRMSNRSAADSPVPVDVITG